MLTPAPNITTYSPIESSYPHAPNLDYRVSANFEATCPGTDSAAYAQLVSIEVPKPPEYTLRYDVNGYLWADIKAQVVTNYYVDCDHPNGSKSQYRMALEVYKDNEKIATLKIYHSVLFSLGGQNTACDCPGCSPPDPMDNIVKHASYSYDACHRPPTGGIVKVYDVPLTAYGTVCTSDWGDWDKFKIGVLTQPDDTNGQTAWIGFSQNYYPNPPTCVNSVCGSVADSYSVATFLDEVMVMAGENNIRAMNTDTLGTSFVFNSSIVPDRIVATPRDEYIALSGHIGVGPSFAPVVSLYSVDATTLEIYEEMAQTQLVDPTSSDDENYSTSYVNFFQSYSGMSESAGSSTVTQFDIQVLLYDSITAYVVGYFFSQNAGSLGEWAWGIWKVDLSDPNAGQVWTNLVYHNQDEPDEVPVSGIYQEGFPIPGAKYLRPQRLAPEHKRRMTSPRLQSA